MKGTSLQCRKCNRPRPEPDSEQSWRWMCPVCSRDDFTMSGEYTHCTDCGRKCDYATDPHWQMRFALAESGEQGGGGGDAQDQKRKRKKRGGKRQKKAPPPSEPGLVPAAGAESSEDSAGYTRPTAKRRSKFASGGRRASAPLIVARIAILPTMVSSVNPVQPTAIISAGWLDSCPRCDASKKL